MNYFARRMLFALSFIVLSACSQEPEPQNLRGNIFGTFFEVSVGAQHEIDKDSLESGIMQVLNEVDRQMSNYREDSDLNRINNAELHQPVSVPADLFYVLQKSEQVAQMSGGAFDHTVGSLINLWGFGPDGRVETAPPQEALDRELERVGYHYVILDEDAQTVKRTSDLSISLSAIAKGFGSDAVSQYLLEQGIDNHLVNIGGDIMSKGKRAPGQNWRIGIEAPNDTQQMVRHILPIEDTAMVSSGDYRNYFEEDGVRYSHTIDPTTGYPIAHNLAAVTVLTDNATLADGYATVLMVKGVEQGVEFADKYDFAALFIVRSEEGFETIVSERFQREHAEQMSAPRVQ
ncbi:FAD:protein FMN transferase ApbE [Aliidiomarina minuta]|uniref:FAD:protein FMN transferase n=1 Tax=Aliidiomarina minuta TaxID=880057 RepID=A0A432WAN9_9GAMM|nr:FAD:protein FMN transferase [Aliidiomarina minuta]RUO27046.1 FAD:protein FMN transferase ApbE [Aliidiomarina minuta]